MINRDVDDPGTVPVHVTCDTKSTLAERRAFRSGS